MFAKLIADLSGLPPEEEEEEGYEGRRSREGSTDLVASSLGSKRRAKSSSLSRHPSASTMADPDKSVSSCGGNPSFSSDSKRGPWKAFTAAVPRILDSLLGSEEGEGGNAPALSPERRRHRELWSHKASATGYNQVEEHISSPRPTDTWNHHGTCTGFLEGDESESAPEQSQAVVPPAPVPLLPPPPDLPPVHIVGDPSDILSEEDIEALAAFVPSRFRLSPWTLLYSTSRDGISLHTLLRRARGKAPTILVVRDMQKSVFGAYCSEPWKNSALRYYGTGETFVFQIKPGTRRAWSWWWQRMSVERNDFFMLTPSQGIAVGGSGGYALWLDEDLLNGISRYSGTFGSPCLAGSEEFEIGSVELWHLQ